MRATDLLGRVIDETEAGQLPILIEEWLETQDERHWLGRALRLDLALLVERPELVVPCLLRRTLWLGGERTFADQRPDLPAGAQGLLELAMRWDGAWGASHRYLRTLRTPDVPLDGGALEEYRSHATGPLWITADHVGLGGAIAWERARGRQVRVPAPPPRAPDPRGTFTLDDELLITAALDVDDDGYTHRYACVERATQRRRFVHDGECMSAIRMGDRIVVKTRNDYRVHALDGRVIVDGALVGDELVAGPDHTIATRAHDVLRVWDLAKVRVPPTNPNYRSGLVAIAADGECMLAGKVVCDARTGKAIAELDLVTRDGWLEGGPPRECNAICDGVVGSLSPFGYRLWDSGYGNVMEEDRDHRGTHEDAVAWDPSGRVHALLHAGVVRVFDNRSLAQLFEVRVDLDGWASELGFSRDGSTLWVGKRGEVPRSFTLRGTTALPRYEPRRAAIVDGVVTLDGLSLPIDDVTATISDDGDIIAGWTTHYVRS